MNVFDVAKYILDKMGEMTTWKLQKLVYYSQVWSLVWDERPLFEDDFEAWANGPVVRPLFNAHKGRLNISAHNLTKGDALALDAVAQDTVNAVIRDYGPFSGRELSQIAHSERPWKEARKGIPAGEASEEIIDRDVIIDFYTGLDNEQKQENIST